VIDQKLNESGWLIQDKNQLNLTAGPGVAVREFPTSTGPVDYALFVDGALTGIVEAKRSEMGEHMAEVEEQTNRYAASKFRGPKQEVIRFVYRATDQLIWFTDFADMDYRSRKVFSFHRPETMRVWLSRKTTLRNALKAMPPANTQGFRDCQITAIANLDKSLAQNKPKALIQMATGAGKTFTAITASYRMLKYGRMNRILFLVDTKNLGEQAEEEFMAYTPNDENKTLPQLYAVHRLRSSRMPQECQVYIGLAEKLEIARKQEQAKAIKSFARITNTP
jgi:type I restriction enzyme R subunit